ncbi:heme lyase CcmF/NrfE family subunit [Photobacterium rosenbergii]|uniref:heme lyase CcmF/NrfE family subunit n=1 Tax=Photobacterium rosenbergii TaxID=294936 RepID=UPI001C99E523|nr:heme lyase CcmF/NrfE family subunit [Photobacterium rosenbergii]MBY5945647.1 heme lyase CcmF/NrfE family subunit [Photobacterium rosenbergii]
MLPEVGHFSLILGMVFALLGATVPVVGLVKKDSYLTRYAWPLSYGAFSFIGISIILLGVCFALDDFSVAYVAHHSNTQLPIFFKLAAVWGGHEGSFLFWLFSLTLWTALVARVCRKLDEAFIARVLVTLSGLVLLFSLFVLLTSNPFERLFPTPLEGRDLNPMLQDVGLIFHPPMLYLGYVGFAVSFAFAIAALTGEHGKGEWAKWSRPWTLAAWVFLTGGIALGSWWAYYELGWGGWWFWDPVENASLMPWLTGTALIHSLMITEYRKALSGWSLLLAIFTFSLSLLGTFIVRSGVLTSVHAFAVDPTRGVTLLAMLALILIVALSLFAVRSGRYFVAAKFGFLSKEAMFMVGNSLFVVSMLTVLLGTFYPLVFQALGLGNISVGAPYFNAMFVPMSFVLFLFMGLGVVIRWHKVGLEDVITRSLAPMSVSIVLGVALSVMFERGVNITVCLAFITAIWIALCALQAMYMRILARRAKGMSGIVWKQAAMVIAHIGVSATIIGATLVSFYDQEISSKMGPGDAVSLGEYHFTYQQTDLLIGPNYTAEQAQITVIKDDALIATIRPERRHYTVRTMNMSEPGIAWFWHGDIYITLGEKLNRTDYAVRIQYKPYVRWLWLGSILMMIGGAMAVVSLASKRVSHKLQQPKKIETIVLWK